MRIFEEFFDDIDDEYIINTDEQEPDVEYYNVIELRF